MFQCIILIPLSLLLPFTILARKFLYLAVIYGGGIHGGGDLGAAGQGSVDCSIVLILVQEEVGPGEGNTLLVPGDEYNFRNCHGNEVNEIYGYTIVVKFVELNANEL